MEQRRRTLHAYALVAWELDFLVSIESSHRRTQPPWSPFFLLRCCAPTIRRRRFGASASSSSVSFLTAPPHQPASYPPTAPCSDPSRFVGARAAYRERLRRSADDDDARKHNRAEDRSRQQRRSNEQLVFLLFELHPLSFQALPLPGQPPPPGAGSTVAVDSAQHSCDCDFESGMARVTTRAGSLEA